MNYKQICRVSSTQPVLFLLLLNVSLQIKAPQISAEYCGGGSWGGGGVVRTEDLDLCGFSYTSYLEKRFNQIYRALCGDAMLVSLRSRKVTETVVVESCY